MSREAGRDTMYVVDDLISALLGAESAAADAPPPSAPPPTPPTTATAPPTINKQYQQLPSAVFNDPSPPPSRGRVPLPTPPIRRPNASSSSPSTSSPPPSVAPYSAAVAAAPAIVGPAFVQALVVAPSGVAIIPVPDGPPPDSNRISKMARPRNTNVVSAAAAAPMTLRGWSGDVVILTVNVPHIESTSKFKFKLDMSVDDAIAHIKDTLKKRGFLFGADLDAPYALLTLGGRAAPRTRTGSLFAMKPDETLADYGFQTGDMLYFKPLFTPSAHTVAAAGAGVRDSDADMDNSLSSPQPPRASFVKKAALPAPIGDGTIQHAAQQGDCARVQEVLALSKISPDTQDVHGNTALMWACARGHLDVVQLLLRSNAGVDVQSNSGATALLYAAKKGKDECVRALLAANANPNLRDENGGSPVAMAAKGGKLDMVADLLQHGADVGARDTTALLWAAKRGHLEIVRLLLAHGADKMVATADGKRALDLALAARHAAVADVLRAWGPELVRLAPSDIELGRDDVVVQLEIRNFAGGTAVVIDGVDVPTTELRRAADVVTVQIRAPQSDFPCFRHIELTHATGARSVAQRALRYGQPSQEAAASLRIGAFDRDAGYVPPPAPPGVPSRSAPSSPRGGFSSAPPPEPPELADAPPPVAARRAPPPPTTPRTLASSLRGAPMPVPRAAAPPMAAEAPVPLSRMSKVSSTPTLPTPTPPPLPVAHLSAQPPPEPDEPAASARSSLGQRRNSPIPDAPIQRRNSPMPPAGAPAAPLPDALLRRNSPMPGAPAPPPPPMVRHSFAGAPPPERASASEAAAASAAIGNGTPISKPTDVTRNRDAVKALLTSAGVDASIVDRKPGTFIPATSASVAAPAASGTAAIAALERTALYSGGFSDTNSTILWFWDWLHGLSSMELSTLNHMLTGNALSMPTSLRLAKVSGGISVSDVGATPTLNLPVFPSKADMIEQLKKVMMATFMASMK